MPKIKIEKTNYWVEAHPDAAGEIEIYFAGSAVGNYYRHGRSITFYKSMPAYIPIDELELIIHHLKTML